MFLQLQKTPAVWFARYIYIYIFVHACSAARFLHENGILLHFDDPLRGLSTLFFIDPSWLIDMLALVVTVKERNPYPFIDEGYIDKEKMMLILRDPRLPVTFIPQVNIQLFPASSVFFHVQYTIFKKYFHKNWNKPRIAISKLGNNWYWLIVWRHRAKLLYSGP